MNPKQRLKIIEQAQKAAIKMILLRERERSKNKSLASGWAEEEVSMATSVELSMINLPFEEEHTAAKEKRRYHEGARTTELRVKARTEVRRTAN